MMNMIAMTRNMKIIQLKKKINDYLKMKFKLNK